jgi:DNA-binding NtrC family response regulator
MNNTVLLVDDDRNLLRGLARALRHQPYQLYTAASGEEAILILKAHRVDVIVSDEQMPGMCGSDLLAWVAENYPEVVRIVLTGRPTVEAAIRAINEGAVFQFFTKPCNPAFLGVGIRKALEHKATFAENRQLLDTARSRL